MRVFYNPRKRAVIAVQFVTCNWLITIVLHIWFEIHDTW